MADQPTAIERFINGILPENPVYRQLLAHVDGPGDICPQRAPGGAPPLHRPITLIKLRLKPLLVKTIGRRFGRPTGQSQKFSLDGFDTAPRFINLINKHLWNIGAGLNVAGFARSKINQSIVERL